MHRTVISDALEWAWLTGYALGHIAPIAAPAALVVALARRQRRRPATHRG